MANMKRSTNTDINKYFADFETTSVKYYKKYGETKVGLWGIMKGTENEANEQFKGGAHINEFLELIFTLKHRSIIFFHNLSGDGYFLMCQFHQWKQDGALDDGKLLMNDSNTIYSMELMRGDKTIRFQCTNLLFGYMSVASMGEVLGRPKREINYDREEYEISDDDITYLHEDIAIVRDFMNEDKKSPISRTNGRKIKLTAGGVAVSFFSKKVKGLDRFLGTDKLTVDQGDHCKHYATFGALSIYKDSGRNIIHENCTYIDNNSMYPSQCANKRLPGGKPLLEPPNDSWVRLGYYRIKKIIKKDHDMPNHFHAKPHHDDKYKLRPYHEDYYGDPFIIGYGDAEWEQILMTYDVEFDILGYGYFQTTNVMMKPFKELYEYKAKATNPVTRKNVKQNLVSGWGKKGQDRKRVVPEFNFETMERSLIPEIQNDPKKLSPIYLASFILAMARVDLLMAIRSNKESGLYSDTDSCIFSCSPSEIKDIELHPTKLGAGKIEKELKRFKYIRSKAYIYETQDGKIGSTSSGMNNATFDFDTFVEGVTITASEGKKLARRTVKGGYILDFIDGSIMSPENTIAMWQQITNLDKNILL